jgi:hypothetical protein
MSRSELKSEENNGNEGNNRCSKFSIAKPKWFKVPVLVYKPRKEQ